MSSNENEAKVNALIMDLVRRPAVGKKMKAPTSEESGLPLRLHKDLPPGYGEAGEPNLWAPPSYDMGKGKAPITTKEPSAEMPSASAASEKASAAEKAPVVTEEAPVTDKAPESLKKPAGFVMDPLYFMRKRGLKTGPTDVSNPKSPIYNIRTIC